MNIIIINLTSLNNMKQISDLSLVNQVYLVLPNFDREKQFYCNNELHIRGADSNNTIITSRDNNFG